MWLFSTSSVKVWLPNSLFFLFTVKHKRQLLKVLFLLWRHVWTASFHCETSNEKNAIKNNTNGSIFPFSYTIHMKSTACFLFVPICLDYYIPMLLLFGFLGASKDCSHTFLSWPHDITHSSYLLYLLQVLLIRDELSSGRPFPTEPLCESERKALQPPRESELVRITYKETQSGCDESQAWTFTSEFRVKILLIEAQRSFNVAPNTYWLLNQWTMHLIRLLKITEKRFALVQVYTVSFFIFSCSCYFSDLFLGLSSSN